VVAAFTGGSRLTFVRAAFLVGVTAVSFLIDLSPTFLYRLEHGRNPSPLLVTNHPWQDGEAFGLTLTQMLLPADGHRVPALRAVRDKFYASTPLRSERGAMALGSVGSVGLLVLLGAVAGCGRSPGPRGRILYLFGLLTVFAVLVCTVGGFSTLFNLLGTGLARTYNRVSVFIGFLAIAAFFLALDALLTRFTRGRLRAALGLALPAAILGLGLRDQTGETYLADQAAVKAEYDSDADFVARVEASVPKGTMVFQFPYVSFLSYDNACFRMEPYSHFRGFLHSRDLRWSFGATHGRRWDAVQAHAAGRPPEEALPMLAALGFGGVYVDRDGYADGGRAVEASLRRLAGTAPVESRNGRLAFYDLGDYTRRLRASCTDEQWATRQRQAANPVCLEWGSGFFVEEKDESGAWRWCGAHGEITIHNTGDTVQSVALRFRYRAYDPAPATLALGGRLLTETMRIDSGWAEFDRVLQVPPGRQVLTLDCSAAPFVHPSRTIVFALGDASLSDAAPDPLGGVRIQADSGSVPTDASEK
jgi:phosphoglycerol transferase